MLNTILALISPTGVSNTRGVRREGVTGRERSRVVGSLIVSSSLALPPGRVPRQNQKRFGIPVSPVKL